MTYRYESRWEVWKVLEFRDGCVYRTEKIGEVWIECGSTLEQRLDVAKKLGGYRLQAPGMSSREHSFRTVKVETGEVVSSIS